MHGVGLRGIGMFPIVGCENISSSYMGTILCLSPDVYFPLDDSVGATTVINRGILGDTANGVNNGAIFGQPGIGDGNTSAYFNGTSSYINAFSAALASSWSAGEGTFSTWFKVDSLSVWTDGVTRRILYAIGDANNFVEIYKKSTSNFYMWFGYKANSAWSETAETPISPTGWHHLAYTWSVSGNAIKVYFDGTQFGLNRTGLIAWNTALTSLILGGGSGQYWKGWLQHTALWNTALTTGQVQSLAHTNYNGFNGLVITFDDCRGNMYSGFEYAAARGINGTNYCVTNLMNTGGYLTSAQLQAMDSAGWVIGNHTTDHTELATLSEADQETRLGDASAALIALGLDKGAYHVAYPYGSNNADTRTAMTNTGMLTGRTNVTKNIIAPNITEPYGIGTALSITNTTTLDNVKDAINVARTRGKYVALLFHGLVDAAPGSWEWTNANWQALIDWIVSEGITCKTIVDYYADTV